MTAPTERAEKLREMLKGHFYAWVPLIADLTLYLRIPNVDIFDKQPWLMDEEIEVIHPCDAASYIEAVETEDKEASSKFIGRCRDGVCTKCGVEVEYSVHWDDDEDHSSVIRTQLTGNSDESAAAPEGT